MSPLWNAAPEPDLAPISPLGWLRVAWRGLILGTVVFGGLAVLLTLRLIERPLFGARRPLTPWITQCVCRAAFFILGIGFSSKGQLMPMPGAVVANHSSSNHSIGTNSDIVTNNAPLDHSRWMHLTILSKSTKTTD